jgi:hypothetical protein
MKISKTMKLNIVQKNKKRQARLTLPIILIDALEWKDKNSIKVRLDTKSKGLVLTKL